MKNYLSVIILIIVFPLLSFAQEKNGPKLKGYENSDLLKYFDSIHVLKKENLTNLEQSFYCYVVFKIDSNYNIANFEFIEIPKLPLNGIAKKYIENLFLTTNGIWEKEYCANNNNTLKDYLFSINLLYKNESINQRADDGDTFFQYAVMQLKREPRLKDFNFLEEKKIYFVF